MISFETWSLYVLTVLALMSTPGPSHLLMLSNSAAYGFRRSLATGAGDLSANGLQMLAAGLGLAALISAYAPALQIIKWAGVAYLIFMGVRMMRRWSLPGADDQANTPSVSLSGLWSQGFITSAANPKAVVFFTALFPQFIASDLPFWPQFIALSVSYIVIDGLFLSAYGYGAAWITTRLSQIPKIWVSRIGGGLMILAACLLALKRISGAG